MGNLDQQGLTMAEAIELLSGLSPESFYIIESVIEREAHHPEHTKPDGNVSQVPGGS